MSFKDATVFILDLGNSMGKKHGGRDETDIEWMMKWVNDKICDKILTGRKTDYVGVVGARTDDIEYRHKNVTPLSPLKAFQKVDLLRLNKRAIPSKSNSGDILDALDDAITTIEAHCRRLKYKKMICLITNATGECEFEQKIDDLIKRVKTNDIVLRILLIDFNNDDDVFDSDIRNENIEQFKKIESKYFPPSEDGEPNDQYIFAPYQEAVDFVGKPSVQPVRIVYSFTGNIYIGKVDDPEEGEPSQKRIKLDNTLTIPVVGCACTKKAVKPTASTIAVEKKTKIPGDGEESDENNDEDVITTKQRISTIRDYFIEPDIPEGTNNESGERVYLDVKTLSDAYRLGSEVIIFDQNTKELLDSVKNLSTVTGLYVYGVCDLKDIPRCYAMGGSDFIVNSTSVSFKDNTALSSLILTLKLYDRVLIAKYIRRKLSEPSMVILTPYVDESFQALILNYLPFADDFRRFQFPSFLEVKSKSGKPLPKDSTQRKMREPSLEMSQYMSQYIDNFNLDEYGVDEDGNPTDYMQSEEIYNPILHRLKDVIKTAAIKGDSENLQIPPIWPELIAYSKPPTELIENSKPVIDKLTELFEIKPVEKKISSKQTALTEEEMSKRYATEEFDLEKLLNGGDSDSDF